MLQEHVEDDARLVALARAGDSRAFDRLVRRHLRAAHAVALAVLGEPDDAEDVCQDAFVAALERLEDCRSPERFGVWLLQIVRNRARDALRRGRVRRALPLESAGGVAMAGGPHHDAELGELRARLVEGLGALSSVQREVLLLHDLEGWLHAEIGEALSMPEGTVRGHLFHARRLMRTRLEAELRPEG